MKPKIKSIFLTRDEALEMLNKWLGSNNKDKANETKETIN